MFIIFIPLISNKTTFSIILLNLSDTLPIAKERNVLAWKSKQSEVFQLHIHFDPTKQVVACNASALGMGAVLSHIMPDRQERPKA